MKRSRQAQRGGHLVLWVFPHCRRWLRLQHRSNTGLPSRARMGCKSIYRSTTWLCKECPYTAPDKGYFTNHMNKRHNNDTKNCICEDCGYAAVVILSKSKLDGPHQWSASVKNADTQQMMEIWNSASNQEFFFCDKCGYAAFGKSNQKIRWSV